MHGRRCPWPFGAPALEQHKIWRQQPVCRLIVRHYDHFVITTAIMTDQEHTQSETGPYILRPLVKVAALGAEARGNGDSPEQSIQIKITCVDVWG